MITEILYVLIIFAAAIYLGVTPTYNYWKKKGVKYVKPVPFFGNAWEFFRMKKTTGEIFKEFYFREEFRDEKFFGIFLGRRPCLLVKDLDLIKKILIKHFEHFADRAISSNSKIPLNDHLFNLTGWRWRTLRRKLTPAFTSGKIKTMLNIISECALQLDNYLEESARKEDVVEMKKVMSEYTIDIIGTCAFGLQLNTMANPDCEFKQMATQLLQRSFRNGLKRAILVTMPAVANYLGFSFVNRNVNDYFLKIFVETMKDRVEHETSRNDFLQLLIKLKNEGTVGDAEETVKVVGEIAEDGKCVYEWTDEILAAQALVFLLAGYNTSASVMSFALYELARNPDIQERLAKEIRTALEGGGGVMSYEILLGMKYLDMVISETMRLYPPMDNLIRKVAKPYQVEGTDVTLDENTRIFIPLAAIHRDPEYYPDPDRFDPERFTPVEKEKRHPMTFLPFGDGPRSCIGNRFGLVIVKAGLSAILNKYAFEVIGETKTAPEFNAKGFNAELKGGVRLRIKKRPPLK
ncbi:UNVERIFIED_CONTAM: hypothetical protein PYX00_002330 [Menopon gallinae]|uniref:Cytochrome P450 n=1 Tax=Menopon gallinae TaxID=328185 RepID=A0AAW2IGB6_9NEOP